METSLLSPHPLTQQVPMPLATTAAWLVMPPLTVSTPWATCIPMISSGEVSRRTSTTFFQSLSFTFSAASSAENTTLPEADPGDAARPEPRGTAAFKASGSNCGWSRVSSCLGSILKTASSSVIMPSSTMSQAILRAAWAVRFPFLVCSM